MCFPQIYPSIDFVYPLYPAQGDIGGVLKKFKGAKGRPKPKVTSWTNLQSVPNQRLNNYHKNPTLKFLRIRWRYKLAKFGQNVNDIYKDIKSIFKKNSKAIDTVFSVVNCHVCWHIEKCVLQGNNDSFVKHDALLHLWSILVILNVLHHKVDISCF